MLPPNIALSTIIKLNFAKALYSACMAKVLSYLSLDANLEGKPLYPMHIYDLNRSLTPLHQP